MSGPAKTKTAYKERSAHRALHALLKAHSVNAGENLNFPRFPADFNYEGRLQKVLPFDTNSAKTKSIKNPDQLFCVLLIDADKKTLSPVYRGNP